MSCWLWTQLLCSLIRSHSPNISLIFHPRITTLLWQYIRKVLRKPAAKQMNTHTPLHHINHAATAGGHRGPCTATAGLCQHHLGPTCPLQRGLHCRQPHWWHLLQGLRLQQRQIPDTKPGGKENSSVVSLPDLKTVLSCAPERPFPLPPLAVSQTNSVLFCGSVPAVIY